MTERGLPLADGAPACPFVAFADERDERAPVPDHRHRCYAEPKPAPRALAHQEAYCLSSAFPVCPTFQDWARREAARAAGSSPESPAAAASAVSAAVASHAAGDLPANDAATPPVPARDRLDLAEPGDDDVDEDAPPGGDASGAGSGAFAAAARDSAQRNPPRDWAAPPPWLGSAGSSSEDDRAEPPSFLGNRSDPGQGLAGSAADQLAGGSPAPRREPAGQDSWMADAGVAASAAAITASQPHPPSPQPTGDIPDSEAVARPNRRPRAYDQHLGGTNGPDWERPRRSEAYPTIKTRVGLPQIPRLALWAIALVLGALALFFLVPAVLNIGGPSTATSTPSPSPSAAVSLEPTQPPAPTPQVYVIKKNDTLLKVAKAHGVTLEELLAANKDIKDPNKVSEGQQVIIPAPSQAAPDQVSGSAEASAAAP